ncbi:MAG: NADH-quinone oxidoreductase subunit M, partial [Actinomycetota bacterium]
MLLTATLFAPLVGALLVALVPAAREETGRLVALAAGLVTLGLAVILAARFQTGEAGFQLGVTAEWVPAFGVSYRVGVDGVSLPLVLLTTVLTPLAIAGSWRMTDRPRTYLALLL